MNKWSDGQAEVRFHSIFRTFQGLNAYTDEGRSFAYQKYHLRNLQNRQTEIERVYTLAQITQRIIEYEQMLKECLQITPGIRLKPFDQLQRENQK